MATFALLSWPVIAVVLFAQRAIVPAILAATVIPYLFLPEAFGIEFLGMPDLNKTAAISLGLMAGLVLFGSRARKADSLPRLKTGSPAFRLLLFSLLGVIVTGTVLTVQNNREILVYGQTVLPAMRPWDAIGRLFDLIVLSVPFFLGRKYLATIGSHRALLKFLVFSALGYSLLMLIEIRLSPQLHNWTYGYYQHSFIQHIRDGYRPMVFLQHGLWVGFFVFMALMGAAALWKAEGSSVWLWSGGWILVILMVSKNLGAFAIGLMCLAVFFFLHKKMQVWFVILVAMVTLSFPALRQAQLVPVDQILTAAASLSEQRAGSLRFRLYHEDQLLERAQQKPVTGWGSWSRDRIFDGGGVDTSISEGRWIQMIGAWGWFGYIGYFGVLTLPLMFLGITSRRKEIAPETMALGLICSGNLIYMIPNSTLTPVGLLCFGALAGFSQFYLAHGQIQPDVEFQPDVQATNPYTRFPGTRKKLDTR